jgi:iron complex outermembrane recepter protein
MSKSKRPARQAYIVTMAIRRALATVPAATLVALAAAGTAMADDSTAATDAATSATAAGAPPQTSAASQSASAASPKQAQTDETSDLDKVVVHARNRLEPLQDVPISISVVEGSELERLDATSIKDVLLRAGNVEWDQGNQRTSSLAIRGVGKIGQTEAQDPSVVVNVDGISYAYNALTSSRDFIDVDTVEVTRGPQGTLLGKAGSVGAISITSRAPSFTSDAEYSLTYGQRDFLQGWAAGGGAVIDDLLAWRGTVGFTQSKGYITNLYNHDDTYSNQNRAVGRLQFLLTPNENLSARLIVERQPRAGETTNGLTIRTPTPTQFANGAPNTVTNESRLNRGWFTQQASFTVNGQYLYGADQNAVDYATQRPIVSGSDGITLQVNQHLGAGDITSISGFRDFHFNAVNDTGVPFDVTRNSGGFYNDYKQWSEELRFNSAIGNLVDYQTGLYYLRVVNNAQYQKVFGDDAGAYFANNAQYASLSANGNGLYLLRNSLAGLGLSFNSPTGYQRIRNTTEAVFGQANWHITEPFTITTGVRVTREERQNTGSSVIQDQGSGAELDPYSINGLLQGGFQLDAAGNVTANPSVANVVAQKYFNVPTYAALTAAQKAQVAAARAIRTGQIGTLFNPTAADPFDAVLPSYVFSPTYKINSELTAYAAWQYGVKPGIAQFLNAVSRPVLEEKTSDYELGLKSLLLNHKLTFDATLYLMNIRDYQQSLSVLDPLQTAATGQPTFVTTVGNVPRVQAKGIEVDSVFVGIPHTTLRVSAAYNEAVYKEFPNSPQPVEAGNLTGAAAARNVSGQTLAGAAKWTGNAGVDYRLPVSEKFEVHASTNAAFTSRYNSDPSLSAYAFIPGNVSVDAAVGVGRRDQRFDISLLLKNALDNTTPLLKTWNTVTPAPPSWFFLQLSGKL